MSVNFLKPLNMATFCNLNKRNFTLLLLFIAIKIGFSQTTISGGSVFGHWPLSGSPYIINGSIQIPNDSTLTIDPGVSVSFQGTYKFLINGRLLAIGTATDTILFTAADTSIGWRGIRFVNTATTNDSSKIIYCKIQYGKATGAAPENKGGGIYFENVSKVRVSNSSISNCTANDAGGGICINSSSPNITNNKISYNKSIQFLKGAGIAILAGSNALISNNLISYNSAGGGIYISAYSFLPSSPIISYNTIEHNNSNAGNGGGINVDGGGPIILNNTILNNSGGGGGGISLSSNGEDQYSIITNNIISYNYSDNIGGGISCTQGNTIISNNTIFNNIAISGGAGIQAYADSIIISNNIISKNTVLTSTTGGGGISVINCDFGTLIYNNLICNNNSPKGGGISLYDASPTLTNNTISNNHASVSGAAINCISTNNPVFYNCIIWGNTADSLGSQLFFETDLSDPNFYYCNIQGGSLGFGLNNNFYTGIYQNNIDTDPMFVSPSGGSGTSFDGLIADWSLQDGSPCINAGNPTGTYGATDIAGNTRVSGGIIDMGAYELQVPNSLSERNLTSKTQLYPNPSSGSFKINTADGALSKIEIVDLLGKVVYSKAFQQQNSNNEIELSNPEKGVYFAKYTVRSTNQNAEQVFTEKIVIQ